MRFALAAIVLVLAAQTASAAVYNYAGGTGNWNDAAKWGGTGFPSTSSDTEVFDVAGNVSVPNSYTVGAPAFNADMTITVASSKTLKFLGTVTGSGKITKAGSGKVFFDGDSAGTSDVLLTAGNITLSGGGNIINGNLKITGGTLQYYESNRVGDTSTVEMSGGFINFSGSAETVGVFTLSGNAGMNDLAGTDVHFANSSAAIWTGTTLNIEYIGIDGVGSIYFGTDTTGLTADQLAKIRFVEMDADFNETGKYFEAGWDPAGNGKIIPVPEPATLGLLILGGLGVIARRRRA